MSRKGGVFMRVHLPGNGGMTMVENTFIDRFMPAASGDFVKIYLYLLRCVQEGHTDVTVSQIADALNYTEADVKRALGYWKRMRMRHTALFPAFFRHFAAWGFRASISSQIRISKQFLRHSHDSTNTKETPQKPA